MYMNNYSKKIKKLQEGIDKLLQERNDKIVRFRSEGLTYKKIGDIFGLSREAVRVIIAKEKKKKTTPIDKK